MRCLNAHREAGPQARHKGMSKRIKKQGFFAGAVDIAADPFGIGGGIMAKAVDPLGIEGDVTGKILGTMDSPKVEEPGADVAIPLSPLEQTGADQAAIDAAEEAKKRRGLGAAGTVLTSPLGVTGRGKVNREKLTRTSVLG